MKKTDSNRADITNKPSLLASYYSIKGDGVAHANIDKIVRTKAFASSIEKLNSLSVQKENNN